MKHSEALGKALWLWGMDDVVGPEPIMALARTGLFNTLELSKIDGKLSSYSINQMFKGKDWEGIIPPFRFGESFNVKSLSALYMLALEYETEGWVNAQLIKYIVTNGTSIPTIARMTGVPHGRVAASFDLQ